MNADELLRHYERVADAPGAVIRLRRFVLDLAMRGKLVDRSRADEPASQLLRRISSDKARLVAAGHIRLPKPVPPLEAEPFALPEHWCWTQLAEIGFISPRNDAPDDTMASFVPMTLVAAEYGVKHGHQIRPWGEIKKGFTHFANEDVGLAKITPCFENGKSAVFRELSNGIGGGTTELHIVRPVLVSPDYIVLVLKSPYFIETGIPRMTGTAGQKRIPAEYFANSPFPLPPLAEQHRIVAKVDELMALCDRLEAMRAKREAARDRLTAASLAHLNMPDPETFRDDARFALDALPALSARNDQIKQIRQTVLSLAVRGLLVRQDPADEPTAALATKIVAAKVALANTGGLKKDKDLAPGAAEPPYPLPPTWVWLRLQDAFEISRGGSPRPAGDPRYFGGNIPWITVREITKDGLKYLDRTEAGLTEEGAARSRFINPGDLLLTNSGATLGVPKISRIRGCMNDGVAVLRLFHEVPLNDFAYLYLLSQTEAFRRVNQGMGQPNLNTSIIAGWFFPLPPLEEQGRIVQRVDALIAICDQLEAGLLVSTERRALLLDSLLERSLQPAEQAEVAA